MGFKSLSPLVRGFVYGLIFILITYPFYLLIVFGDLRLFPFSYLGLLFLIPQAIVGFGILRLNPESTGHLWWADFIGILIWLGVFTLVSFLIGRRKNS